MSIWQARRAARQQQADEDGDVQAEVNARYFRRLRADTPPRGLPVLPSVTGQVVPRVDAGSPPPGVLTGPLAALTPQAEAERDRYFGRHAQTAPARACTTDPAALAQALPALWDLDLGAVDEAQAAEGLTYAQVMEDREGRLPVFDQLEDDRLRAGAQAAPRQDGTVPVPGVPGVMLAEGTVRRMLAGSLASEQDYFEAMDYQGCAECGPGDRQCCFHKARREWAQGYAALRAFASDCACDADALHAVASAVWSGEAVAAHIGQPGTALDRILSAALGTMAGAR